MNTKCQNLHQIINSEIPHYLPNSKPLKTLFKVKKKKAKAIGTINQLETSLSNVSYKKINKFIQNLAINLAVLPACPKYLHPEAGSQKASRDNSPNKDWKRCAHLKPSKIMLKLNLLIFHSFLMSYQALNVVVKNNKKTEWWRWKSRKFLWNQRRRSNYWGTR